MNTNNPNKQTAAPSTIRNPAIYNATDNLTKCNLNDQQTRVALHHLLGALSVIDMPRKVEINLAAAIDRAKLSALRD